MSDEMKPTSEDAKITAGNAPRRDSAEAAALTVGSPSSYSSQTARSGSASKRTSLSLATRAGIAALAVLSVLFIGASAFALTNGFGLPADSPVVKAAESVGIVRSADVEASSADGADEAKAGKGEDSNEADAANKESEDKKDASSDASGSDESKSKGDGSSSDNSDSSGSSDSGSSSSSGGSSSSNAGSGSSSSSSGASSSSSGSSNSSSSAGGSSQPGTSAPAGTVTVYVSVSSSAVGNPVSGGGTFTFNQGATVYDALCACGLSMNASNTGYGIYVSAIGGLAEKEHGGHSGWMYSVNGAVPMTACSNYVLSNGDFVSWYYVTG